MAIYISAQCYITSVADKKARLVKIKAVLTALDDLALAAAAGDNISSYTLDNGQTKVNTEYRSLADVERSIAAFERIKNRLEQDLNGGAVIRLVDGSNLRGGINGIY